VAAPCLGEKPRASEARLAVSRAHPPIVAFMSSRDLYRASEVPGCPLMGSSQVFNQLEVTARLFGPVSFREVRKFRRHVPMACTPVMVRGMSSGDRTSMKMAKALTLDMVHSHFCTKRNNRNRYGRWVIRPDAL